MFAGAGPHSSSLPARRCLGYAGARQNDALRLTTLHWRVVNMVHSIIIFKIESRFYLNPLQYNFFNFVWRSVIAHPLHVFHQHVVAFAARYIAAQKVDHVIG